MATKTYYLTGKCKWAKLDVPDKEYGLYSIDLYPDEGSWKKFKESGCAVQERQDDDGENYIRLRRDPKKLFDGMPEKPEKFLYVTHEDGTSTYEPFEKLIGNDSVVNCKISVFDTRRGKGHRLEAVAVENLVPYGDDDHEYPF